MSRQQPQLPVSSPRLLASAIGMAITAGSAGHMVFAAEKTDEKAPGNVISLGATAITGEAQDETTYNVEKASSPKYTAPLVDTPRSITVIPQQVLKDTGALNMQDALRTVPGITFGAGEGGNPQGDRPFIRGFDAQGDTYLDGVRDTGSQSREIFAVESIEVSKGPNSAIGGRGAAGGSINLVSKKAHLGDSLDGGFTWGSDQTQRYTFDGNYQFTDTAAGRLNLMSHESNVAGRDKRRLRPLGCRTVPGFRPGHRHSRQPRLLPPRKQRHAGFGHSVLHPDRGSRRPHQVQSGQAE